jgi:ribokinase
VIHRTGEPDERVPAPTVPVIDTTGAGDCFNGVLAAKLAWGAELTSAVRTAVVAAALSVGVAGAREGMLDPDELADARERLGL